MGISVLVGFTYKYKVTDAGWLMTLDPVYSTVLTFKIPDHCIRIQIPGTITSITFSKFIPRLYKDQQASPHSH